VLKGSRFHELLISPSDIVTVAKGVDILQVRRYCIILCLDGIPVLLVCFLNVRWYLLVKLAYSSACKFWCISSQKNCLLPLKRKYAATYQLVRIQQLQYTYIFLLAAVMSRDALIVRSRLSWCSSSSSRNCSNIDMKGDCGFEVSMFGSLKASAALLLSPALDMLDVRDNLKVSNEKSWWTLVLAGTWRTRNHLDNINLDYLSSFYPDVPLAQPIVSAASTKIMR
jgi:hypothetical protein